MPFEPHRAVGYAPTMEDILADLGIADPADLRETLLSRCERLYHDAQERGSIESFGTTQEFVVCDSSEFYRTLVDMGQGNMAVVISDDYGPRAYFLLFDDKVPVRYRPVVASHESLEYHLVNDEGWEQGPAHKRASEAEMKTAERLRMKEGYLEYLKKEYPTKVDELKEWDLV
jgi:hypothetical protein